MKRLTRRIAPWVVAALMGANLRAGELPVRFHRQASPVWCWAAVSAMVVSYIQKLDLEDCQVLAEYDMRLGGAGLCCAGAAQCQRGGLGLEEVGTLLGQVFNVHGQYDYQPLDFDGVVAEIDGGRPILAMLAQPGSQASHVVLISGYQGTGTLIVLDPLNGRYSVSYSVLLHNWKYGNWVGTSRIRTDPAEFNAPGCSLVREWLNSTFFRWRVVCRERG